MVKSSKKPSKRQKLSQKYNVEKKIRAHKRKVRKAARQNAPLLKTKKKKSVFHVPNSCPFKADILAEAERRREQRERERAEKRERLREQRKEQRKVESTAAAALAAGAEGGMDEGDYWEDDGASGKMAMEDLRRSALAAAEGFDRRQATDSGDAAASTAVDDGGRARAALSSQAHYRQLRRVIDAADVIIEVLDAREPNGCRSLEVEQQIIAAGKRLIFVINKIDLVPREAVSRWLTYLRRFCPAIAFKAAVGAANRIRHSSAKATSAPSKLLQSSSEVVGGGALLQLLKNYARVGEKKTGGKEYNKVDASEAAMDEGVGASRAGPRGGGNSETGAGGRCLALSVGIIGQPNVGKSSIINSLKRKSNVAAVGGEAGVTRVMQEVMLDSRVKLIDSPGVVFLEGAGDPSCVSIVLRNAVKLSKVQSLVDVVAAMVDRCPREVLMKTFQIPSFDDANSFLTKVALCRGKLRKGGVPDLEAAARLAVTQWTKGKLRFYTLPPDERTEEEKESLKIVSEAAPELNLDDVWKEMDDELEAAGRSGAVGREMDTKAICLNRPSISNSVPVVKRDVAATTKASPLCFDVESDDGTAKKHPEASLGSVSKGGKVVSKSKEFKVEQSRRKRLAVLSQPSDGIAHLRDGAEPDSIRLRRERKKALKEKKRKNVSSIPSTAGQEVLKGERGETKETMGSAMEADDFSDDDDDGEGVDLDRMN